MRVSAEHEVALVLFQVREQATGIAIVPGRDATANRGAVAVEADELYKISTAKAEGILLAAKQEAELTVGKAERKAEEILILTCNESGTLRRSTTDEATVIRSEATELR